jgi:2-methylisocitrate lyase-like PEP mutase family enzyme
VPVTADIESGYGDVAATVADVIEAGAVGVNIEDSPNGTPLDPDAQAERLVTAREAAKGLDLCINARTDTYLAGKGSAEERLADTMARAQVYAEAGADVLFVPGVVDKESIATLVGGPLPLNVMVHPGALTVPELAALGVARISVGTAIAQAAYGLAAKATRELLSTGTYGSIESDLGYGELNNLLS